MTEYRLDLLEIKNPGDLDRLLELLASRTGGQGRRITARLIRRHGVEPEHPGIGELLEQAWDEPVRPGVSVQAAVRNLPADPAGNGFTRGPGFTKNLEIILNIRHAHEPDIRTVVVEQELAEETRRHEWEQGEDYRISVRP